MRDEVDTRLVDADAGIVGTFAQSLRESLLEVKPKAAVRRIREDQTRSTRAR
jgi:hypothetical protein